MGTNEKRRKANVRQIEFLVLFILAVAVGLYAYLRYSAAYGTVVVRFETPSGALTPPFRLEVADTPAKRSKGLMYRKPGELQADEGMIFVYEKDDIQRFWMRETYIPLDMIFLDRNLKVVGILEDVPILNDKERSIDRPSRFVVELLAGSAKKHGIQVGSKAKLEGSLTVG